MAAQICKLLSAGSVGCVQDKVDYAQNTSLAQQIPATHQPKALSDTLQKKLESFSSTAAKALERHQFVT